MLRDDLQTLITRELRALRRELEAYPDDDSVWKAAPGTPNSAGTLALHLAGNLRHFLGAVLGKDGYKRDREAEFARRDVSRADLLIEIDAAEAAVKKTLRKVTDAELAAPYPLPIADRKVPTAVFLMHIAVHLTYHLGQLDYHRRVVTGDTRGVDAVSVRELPEIK